MRDIETIDSELRLVVPLRRAARERDGPLPSIDVADVLLDERRELASRLRRTARSAYPTGAGSARMGQSRFAGEGACSLSPTQDQAGSIGSMVRIRPGI